MVDKSVADVFGKRADIRTYQQDASWVLPNGMIGVEIELEGFKKDPFENKKTFWLTTKDDSLRMVEDLVPYEFRFIAPLCGADLTKAITEFGYIMNRLRPHPVISYRCSTHVHLDVRDLKLFQLLKLVILYTIFERILVNFADKERANNNFCLPFYKAEAGVFNMLSPASVTDENSIVGIPDPHLRYAALNLDALRKFGSVEFRHMGGTYDSDRLSNWINVIMCLKAAAINDALIIKDIPSQFSMNGMEYSARIVFGKYFDLLNYSGVTLDMMEGIRLAQDIIYRDKADLFEFAEEKDYGEDFVKFCELNKIKLGMKQPKAVIPKINWDIIENHQLVAMHAPVRQEGVGRQARVPVAPPRLNRRPLRPIVQDDPEELV